MNYILTALSNLIKDKNDPHICAYSSCYLVKYVNNNYFLYRYEKSYTIGRVYLSVVIPRKKLLASYAYN